jgi:hypothetical protein
LAKEDAMAEQAVLDDARFDELVDGLTEAYSGGLLDDYRALQLKDSFDEQTTCRVQWGPVMRV